MTEATTDPARHVDVCAIGSVVRIVVEDGDETVLAALREAWHLCLVEHPDEVPAESTVSIGPGAAGPGTAPLHVLQSVTQRVTVAAIQAASGRYLMLHAGGLADAATGAAVVYAARSGTGKTTLTRELGGRLAYLSDETIALAPDGTIEPYLKPLSVKRADGGKDEVAPAALGLRPPEARPWLAGLLALERDEHHRGAARVSRLDTLDSIAVLAPETSALARLHRPLRTLADLVERADGVLSVRYRRSEDLREVVEEITGRERP